MSEVGVDKEGRINLSGLRTGDTERYRFEELGDGTIILTPLASITQAELDALRNPGVQQAIARHDSPGVASGGLNPFGYTR